MPIANHCVTILCLVAMAAGFPIAATADDGLFDPANRMAWCIVPFDGKKRSPDERAKMLRDLGIRKFAYDYRAEHIPTFDAEVEALQREGIELTAWWFPATLNDEARGILDVIRRHGVHPQLWVSGGGEPTADEADRRARVQAEANRLQPIAEAAAELGCTVGLYNHGGWFGEPENQLAVVDELRARGIANAGIVYNFHHGHDHLERFSAILEAMKPHLLAVNLHGMDPGGDRDGRKIVPLGQGACDVALLRILRDSGWRGPVGLLNHTDEDADLRLRDNLDGLDWIVSQLDENAPRTPRPTPRSWTPPPVRTLKSGAAVMPLRSAPLDPAERADWQIPVNAGRVYDFYAKQADWVLSLPERPALVSEFPGLQGADPGHWGTQDETSWTDGRWNLSDPGTMQSGVFRLGDLTVPRAICVRLDGISVCFDPDTLTYRAAWSGGFVTHSTRRWGLLDGIRPDGEPVPIDAPPPPAEPFRYLGCLRIGNAVVFRCEIGGKTFLDSPSVKDGKFVRTLEETDGPPPTGRGAPQWPEILTTNVVRGTAGGAYAIDTIVPPFDNPWKALMFFGGHDFSPDGTAWLCTIQGDVWRVTGIGGNDDERPQWKRFASGLHQPLGLVFAEGTVFVGCRDRIVRLHDRNGDGEADEYESFSDTFVSSPAGHDFVCGLERDGGGRFYLASGNQGLLRISADGATADVLATGFRNPDGLALLPDGSLTVPLSEGEWTPSSAICFVRAGGDRAPFFGYGGPRNAETPSLPMVYVPRGADNSSGGQMIATSDRWGPLSGSLLHFSYGAGTAFVVLRDNRSPVPQGAVVPLPGEFASGVHRGRVNPADGQVYVSGMTGWGTYSSDDGCFQRLRFTGAAVSMPSGIRMCENGVRVEFTDPVDPAVAGIAANQFAQAWNYRYSKSYGSAEYSPSRPGVKGHDVLAVAAVHVADDRRSAFLEIPDLQPVSQLHLRLRTGAGVVRDVFATVHSLGPPFDGFPGYRPVAKWIRPHPIVADLSQQVAPSDNPYVRPIADAVPRLVRAGTNLTYLDPALTIPAGTPVALTFRNPDVVPHNWVLVKPGRLHAVGEAATQLIADAAGAARAYVPDTDDVLAWTPMVDPGGECTVWFRTPDTPGDFPFLCTFPGHWMLMHGTLTVAPPASGSPP